MPDTHRRLVDRVTAASEELDTETRDGLVALATEMEQGGTDKDSPVREIFGLLGDKWSTLILLILSTGTYRHAALKRIVALLAAEETISQRMLTLKLRALERNGLVVRTATDDVPPRVDYALSGMGRGLVDQTRSLIGWIRAHSAGVAASRAAFDAGG